VVHGKGEHVTDAKRARGDGDKCAACVEQEHCAE
jgi:hypothetical protein